MSPETSSSEATQLPVAEELLRRQFHSGTSVVNCVRHMNLDITRRADSCHLCATDVRNTLARAIRINEWLNEWKDDATLLLASVTDSPAVSEVQPSVPQEQAQ